MASLLEGGDRTVKINALFEDIDNNSPLPLTNSTSDFVESLRSSFKKYGRLTDKQYAALCDVHERATNGTDGFEVDADIVEYVDYLDEQF